MAGGRHIDSIRMGDRNVNSGNITGSFNKTINTCDEDAHIMRWLSTLEPQGRHQGVRNDRLDGVGDWLLETKEFQEWRTRRSDEEADGAVLFCFGNPGVGKTYLSSLVIDYLCDQDTAEDIAVACLYCDFLAQEDQTITNIVGAILKQLLLRGDIPQDIREAYRKGKKEVGGRGPRLPDLVGMLKSTLASLRQTFICIDALDECLPKYLPVLLNSLRDVVRDSPTTRIFLTGRPQVGEDIQRCFANAVVIPISPNTDDIRSYLEMRLANDIEPGAMNEELRAGIMGIIPERLSKIFLLVSLNMDAILGEITVRQRKKKLEEMTQGNGLSDAYTATLNRVKAQKGNKSILGLKVLMWVSHSARPLQAEELRRAMGVEIGSTDFDLENVPALRTLLGSALGLVTVEASSSTVRLIHFTLQEYLSSDPVLFGSPHSSIAEVCLTYLNSQYIRDLSPALHSDQSTIPLLEYASWYWVKHAGKEMTEKVKTLAVGLLDGFEEHISAQQVTSRYEQELRRWEIPYRRLEWKISSRGLGWGMPDDRTGQVTGFTGLHGAASFGVVEIVVAILGMKERDLNAVDSTGSTALIWAARLGHGGAVKTLLAREDVNPNTPDTKYGQTPLFWAAQNGRDGVVKTLLAREDVNPNTPDTKDGRTPLFWAAQNGHEAMVKALLAREDVNPNTPDTRYGQTLLCWAAENGLEAAVKALLAREDVNPDTADTEYGRTPLCWAAENGHDGVVKMLLAREDVNPNTPDTKHGRTPLCWAAEKGHDRVVKMLLAREDVNPNTPDTRYGRTLLCWAARNGHEAVVKALLAREDVNPNTPDTRYGQTPLCWAAQKGYEVVVKFLLAREDVNPNTPDSEEGLTPLCWAAENGHGGIVKALLAREDVNPNTPDTRYGQTPLCWAARYGHVRVVKTLLAREDVNPNTPDTEYGQTPLFWAAENGHDGVVKMLLAREDVNPNTPDTEYGQTPLCWAAENGLEAVVEALLTREDIDPDTADTEYGQTPLCWAAENGHGGIVKMLLAREDVNPDTADTKNGRTPLLWATMRGHVEVVKIFLKREDVRIDTPDNENETPLSLALSKRYNQVVKLLQDRVSGGSAAVGSAGVPITSQSSGHGVECVVDMQSRGGDLGTDIADLDAQKTLSSTDLGEREQILDCKDSGPSSGESHLSSTGHSSLLPLSPQLPPNVSPRKIDTQPHNSRSPLPITVDRYLIFSFISLLAFLIYLFPSLLPIIFSF